MAFKHKAEKKKPIHVCICTPAYDGKVEVNYAQSIAESAWCAAVYGVQVTAAVMGNGAFIDLARNLFVKKFLELHKECTHLFFVDADLRFHPHAFLGLLQSGHPICAGIYRRRQEPEDYPFRILEEPKNGGLWFIDDWLQCDRVPTGFLCISREVLEEMSKDAPTYYVHGEGQVPQLFYTKVLDGKFIGEDYCFCDDYVKKYGKGIPVWANLEFIHGGYKGNFFEWMERDVERQKREREENASSAA